MPNSHDPAADKSRLHAIIEALPTGVLVTNAQGQVVLMNPAVKQHIGLPVDLEPGRLVENYIPDEGLCGLIMDISNCRPLDFDAIQPYEFPAAKEKYLQARCRPVFDAARNCLGAAITIEDITAMKVVDRLKSEFVAKVSHELRSPLSTIHEQLAAVLNDMMGRSLSADTRLLSRAKEKTRGLISLIGDLLDLSRIESGAVCTARKPVMLVELLENLIEFLHSRAAAKHQNIIFTPTEGTFPPIQADPLALESIFGNLISNAIDYTPENGRIEVRLSRVDVNLKVEVIDDGFGIESRHLERIFDRFYRVKNERTRNIPGTGLGLPIVKGLLEALQGSIHVESVPGRGSVFTVLLPPAAAEAS